MYNCLVTTAVSKIGFSEMHRVQTVEEHVGLAMFVAKRITKKSSGDVVDTDEYSDCLIGLWKACETWNPDRGKFSTYAFRCMILEVGNGWRTKNRKKNIKTLVHDFETFQDREEKPQIPNELVEEILTIGFEDSSYVIEAKKLVQMRFVQKLTLDEIGHRIGCSKAVAHNRIKSAKKILKNIYKKRYEECERPE